VNEGDTLHTGLSLIKNCNFEAGWLRADVQFKFNLSPDWYVCSSPFINGPLVGRSVYEMKIIVDDILGN